MTLSNEMNASELLQYACLRQSSAATGIYISANLTPAEALAAYHVDEWCWARRSAMVAVYATWRTVVPMQMHMLVSCISQ